MVKCRSMRVYKSDNTSQDSHVVPPELPKSRHRSTKSKCKEKTVLSASQRELENDLKSMCNMNTSNWPRNRQDASEDEVCVVDWDSRSPVTLTQVARYKKHSVDISNFVLASADEYETMPTSRTPPLLGLWMDKSSNPDKNLAHRPFRSRGVVRKRGRPSGIKRAVTTKDFFNKLESVLKDGSPESENGDISENQTPQRRSVRLSQKPSTSTVSSISSTEVSEFSLELFDSTHLSCPKPATSSSQLLPVPELQATDSSSTPKIQKTKPDFHSPPNSRKLTSDEGTPKRPIVQAAVRQFLPDESLEDLWTDEELFEDDSFITKATLMASDLKSPRLRATPKRKTACPSPLVSGLMKNGTLAGSNVPSDTPKAEPNVQEQRKRPASPFQSYYEKNRDSKVGNVRIPSQVQASQSGPKKFTYVKPQMNKPSTVIQNSTDNMSQRPLLLTKTGVLTEKSSFDNNKKSSRIIPMAKPNPPAVNQRPISSNVPPANVNKFPFASATKQMDPRLKVTPQKNNSKTMERHWDSPSVMDMSITDDLLACLAEPDDLLDSQVLAGSIESPPSDNRRSLNITTVGVLNPSATSTQMCAKPPVKAAPLPSKSSSTEEFPDEDEDDDLLALVEFVESSQEKPSKPTANRPSAKLESHSSVSKSGIHSSVSKAASLSSVSNAGSISSMSKTASHSSIPKAGSHYPVPKAGSLSSVSKTASHSSVSKPGSLSSVSKTASHSSVPKAGIHSSTTSGLEQCRKPVIAPQGRYKSLVMVPTLPTAIKVNTHDTQINNGLNIPTGSKKPFTPSPLSSASQKYSKEEIERKKQEALKRRQNRLKLTSRPR